MKVEFEWLVLCKQVLLDANTRNFTLVECIEQLQVPIFPSAHRGFAIAARFRLHDVEEDTVLTFRIVRASEGSDEEEVIAEMSGPSMPSARRIRVYQNFDVLRLRRPETALFRVDHRLPGEDWTSNPATALEILELPLEGTQREKLESQLSALQSLLGTSGEE